MTFDVLSFILGWFGCCVFIFIAEWLTDIRKSDPMAEAHGDCPWMQTAARETREAGDGLIRHHNQNSSRVLPRGSEWPL